ncbi:MAG TPA: cysteine-rich CWC family protein [Verrucomicrobiota bacterium]|nr:cysteine-rich CWC family protein [Verrucomicrobiota bacterium]
MLALLDQSCPPERCPLCGELNGCQRPSPSLDHESCWCEGAEFPADLRDHVPRAARDRACVCRRCVEAIRPAHPLQPSGPDDFYLDASTGQMVFTAQYHQKRGYCCGNDCRHCPWLEGEPDREGS